MLLSGVMTFAALAAAQQIADEVDAWGMPQLRALLPVAGMTLVEQQAERLRAHGAARMILLIDGIPAGLADAVDRIRARGLPVTLARTPHDVMTAAGDAGSVLLVADGLVAGETLWNAALSGGYPVILTTRDTPMTTALERIDAETRWAGLALLDAAAAPALADAPADWDAQMYLLRSAVQQDVPRADCTSALFVSGDVALARSGEGAAEAANRLLSGETRSEAGLFARWLVGPLIQLGAPALLARQNSGKWAHGVGLAALAGGAGATIFALPSVAIGCGLLAALAQQSAAYVARFRPETGLWRRAGSAQFIAQLLLLFAVGCLARTGITTSLSTVFAAGIPPMLLALSRLLAGRLSASALWPDAFLFWSGAAVGLATLGVSGGLAAATLAALALMLFGVRPASPEKAV